MRYRSFMEPRVERMKMSSSLITVMSSKRDSIQVIRVKVMNAHRKLQTGAHSQWIDEDVRKCKKQGSVSIRA